MIHKVNSSHEHSWSYWAIWKSKKSWFLIIGIILVMSIVICILLVLVNPRWPDWLNRNTIDHIADQRPDRDYTESEVTMVAGSENWLALGTEQGFVLLHKDSRIPINLASDQIVRDITRGAETDDFLALLNDQEILHISPNWYTVDTDLWLPGSEHLIWPTNASTNNINIVANELDDSGWLIAIEGVGVARYLFETESGQRFRQRFWQTGDLSSVALQEAVITEQGVWITLRNGNILFAEKESLAKVPERSVNTPPIVRLDADPSGQWASAKDVEGGLWLFPEDDTGWIGPFFGRESSDCQLQQLTDVTVVRQQESVIWFGASYGLFAYNMDNRHLACLLRNVNVVDIVAPEDSGSSTLLPTILVGSSSGLWLAARLNNDEPCTENQDGELEIRCVSGSTESENSFRVTLLDDQPISAMSLSVHSDLLVYQVHTVQGAGDGVRMLPAPFWGGTPELVTPDEGWIKTERMPMVVGVVPLEEGQLIGTSEGAFLYQPETRIYQDRSVYVDLGEEQQAAEVPRLNKFTHLRHAEDSILAIANGKPLLLSDDATHWINLDPTDVRRPVDLTQVSGNIFGIEGNGELIYFPDSVPASLEIFLTGTAPSLTWNPLESNRALGDAIINDASNWRIAFLNNRSTITYDSMSGHIEERSIPHRIAGKDEIDQILMSGDHLLYLLSDSSVLTESGNVLFGNGSLPFSPEQITAVAPSTGEATILLGGPTGQIMAYDWFTGSTLAVAGGQVTEGTSIPAVTRIQATEYGIWVRLEDGHIFHTWGDSWESEASDYRNWAADETNSTVWMLEGNDLRRLEPEQHIAMSEWEASPPFSSGSGMRDFIENETKYVWQIEEDQVVFFTNSSEVRIYNAGRDTWEERALDFDSQGLSQFVAADGELLVLNDTSIERIDKALHVTRLTDLPTTAEQTTMHLNDNVLQVAYVDDSSIFLRIWDDFRQGEEYHEFRWGKMAVPVGFDLASTVYAEKRDSAVLLADKTGNIVEYEFTTGHWNLLRGATPGQTVHALFTIEADAGLYFLLGTEAQHTVILYIDDNLVTEREYLVYPADLVAPGVNYERFCTPTLRRMDSRLTCVHEDILQNLVQWAGLHPDTVHFPGGEIWLNNGRVSGGAVRGSENFQFILPDGSMDVSAFSVAEIEDTAFSASGQLWVLQNDRLVRLDTTVATGGLIPRAEIALESNVTELESTLSGEIRVQYSTGNSEYWQESELDGFIPALNIQDIPLATLDFAGFKLNWLGRSDGLVRGAWEDSAFAQVWSSTGDELAIQNIYDLALTPAGDLVLITEGGLLVRNKIDFSLQAIYPDIVGAHFVQTFGPQRLFIEDELGQLLELVDSKLVVSEPDALVSVINTGMCQWQVQTLAEQQFSVRVIYQDSGLQRQWDEIDPEQWKFRDDIILGISRSDLISEIWLESEGKSWQFDLANGRRKTTVEDLPPTMGSEIFGNPAVTIRRSDRHLEFSLKDGDAGSLFEGGRFFFDNGQQLIGFDGFLYTLLPDRGIIRRNPTHPAQVTGFWQLPESNGIQYWIEAAPNGLILETEVVVGQIVVWQLSFVEHDGEWLRLGSRNTLLEAESGRISWFREHAGAAYVTPSLVLEGDHVKQLTNWWQTDRFIWDVATCAGALEGEHVLLLSPIGAEIQQKEVTGTLKPIAFWPIEDMSYCDTLRNQGQPMALGVGQIKAKPMYQIKLSDQNKPIISDHIPQSLQVEHVQLNIGHRQSQSSWFSQQWVPTVPGDDTQNISSTLLGFPVHALLRDGQFIFDIADGLSRLDVEAEGSQSVRQLWVSYTGCNGVDSLCIATLNQVQNSGSSGRARLVLDDFWLVDINFRALRPWASGVVVGLYQENGGDWRAVLGQLDNQRVSWEPFDLNEVSERFQVGEDVSLDMTNMNWFSSPRYLWSTRGPLSIMPYGYPLFRHPPDSGGIGLAIDNITSIAVDKSQRLIAIGTSGGVMVCSCINDSRGFLALSRPRLVIELPYGEQLLDIRRMRYDQSGNLWAEYGDEEFQQVAKLNHGQTIWNMSSQNWVNIFRQAGKVDINLGSSGIVVDGQVYERSNDLRQSDQRPLEEIVGFDLDDDGNTLWLVTRKDGVFKILVDGVSSATN